MQVIEQCEPPNNQPQTPCWSNWRTLPNKIDCCFNQSPNGTTHRLRPCSLHTPVCLNPLPATLKISAWYNQVSRRETSSVKSFWTRIWKGVEIWIELLFFLPAITVISINPRPAGKELAAVASRPAYFNNRDDPPGCKMCQFVMSYTWQHGKTLVFGIFFDSESASLSRNAPCCPKSPQRARRILSLTHCVGWKIDIFSEG